MNVYYMYMYNFIIRDRGFKIEEAQSNNDIERLFKKKKKTSKEFVEFCQIYNFFLFKKNKIC